MSISCLHYRTAETECGVCYPCVVTRLRAELAALKAAHAEELRAVAERQREACAMAVVVLTSAANRFTVEGDDARDAVLATPLVTEEK